MDFDDLDDLDPVEVVDASTEAREFDVVVYGATGFIGGLIVEHLESLSSKGSSLKWALAGRNITKLRVVAKKCQSCPAIISAADPVELSKMASQARVVINVAGPHSVCGEDVVYACVNQVTHYIDTATEVLWIKSMVEKFHEKAKEKGVMLVHGAGASCAPDEILCSAIAKKLGPMKQFREYFSQQGGVSGGTVDTMLKEMAQVTPAVLGALADPFACGAPNAGEPREEEMEKGVTQDTVFPEVWLTPTHASSSRSRLLRRTAQLLQTAPVDGGLKYAGKDFLVTVRDWATEKRSALQCWVKAGSLVDEASATGFITALQGARDAGEAPTSGQGPNAAARADGSIRALGVAEGENGNWAFGRLSAGDPLELTAVCALIGAQVLVEELESIKPRERAGVITPGFAFQGTSWLEKLTAGDAFVCGSWASKGPALKVEILDGKPELAEFSKSGKPPNYVLADPFYEKTWQMPAMDAPLDAGKTAWPAFEPMPEERWSKFPRAGHADKPENMGDFKKVVNEKAPGEFWKMVFPSSPEQLREMGPSWLTKALHTSGAMSKDNAIVEFTRFVVKAWDVTKTDDPNDSDFGGAGCKVFLDVKYKNDPGELTEHLFVKMPHEFNGKNERFKNSISSHQDWYEVMFYNLLAGRLPVRMPRGYFCDMSRRTTNFCMILEAIPYGDRWDRDYAPYEILPNPAKYRDWVIPRKTLADMYFGHARAQARFYGWYQNYCSPLLEAKTDQVDRCFREEGDLFGKKRIFDTLRPMGKEERDRWYLQSLSDPELGSWVWSSGQPANIADGFVTLCEEFVRKEAWHTFPKEFKSKAYLDEYFGQSHEMAQYLPEMGWYSNMTPEYFALCHPNAMIDNAFYWRDANGQCQCGMLDWGGCGQVTVIPRGAAGCWIAAEPDFLDEYEDSLILCLLDEFEKVTGKKLDYDEFNLHLRLAYIDINVGNCASVRWCTQLMRKEKDMSWKNVKDRFDGIIDDGFMMRCYYVQTEYFIGMWKKRNPYPYFKQWMQRTGIAKKC